MPNPRTIEAAISRLGFSGLLLTVCLLALIAISGCGGDADSTGRTPAIQTVTTGIEPASVTPGVVFATPPPLSNETAPVTPFTNISREHYPFDFSVWNDRPSAVVFDYDRDGDLDFYVTELGGFPNRLYRNDRDLAFVDVAEETGVAAVDSQSTGAVACDFDNDGDQDLYVGAWGDPNDGFGFRSPAQEQGNKDSLFLNRGDGSFEEITDTAFGREVNLRSALSIACADVDGDGWLDIYVGNLADGDFRHFDSPSHPGHYNILYRNNGDLTFTDVSEQAGVKGPPVVMRGPDGQPILFKDPETGELHEGYDPSVTDKLGNRVGEPTGQTHAVMFFDYDDDGDPDLWVANDGDRLHVYRNDSSAGRIKFTSVARALGIDKVGAWMGFALGDYDGDADLDVFITNIGYHLRRGAPPETPGGSCAYHEAFAWGTCLHFLLRNDGVGDIHGYGEVGIFRDVALSTQVAPSPYMPPDALDPEMIHPFWNVPTGLAAYDFGFGTTFFDYDNDGDQDLYWLGSTIARGQMPGGSIFPGAGRMLRGNGSGQFEDITVRSRLLDILRLNYNTLDLEDPDIAARTRTLRIKFHENGKGLAHGDLNGDGYVDLVGTNSGDPVGGDNPLIVQLSQRASGPIMVWINGGGDHHWITLRLKGRMAIDGTGSNADGIGSRVYLKTIPDSHGQPLVQVQEVYAGSSYLSMDSVELEFGVGNVTNVEEITILWPSGRKQVLTNVSVDQVLLITEPAE